MSSTIGAAVTADEEDMRVVRDTVDPLDIRARLELVLVLRYAFGRPCDDLAVDAAGNDSETAVENAIVSVVSIYLGRMRDTEWISLAKNKMRAVWCIRKCM